MQTIIGKPCVLCTVYATYFFELCLLKVQKMAPFRLKKCAFNSLKKFDSLQQPNCSLLTSLQYQITLLKHLFHAILKQLIRKYQEKFEYFQKN